MKNYKFLNLLGFSILIMCICLLNACKEEGQAGAKPSRLVDYTVTSIYGGATITYDIPKDNDILYVIAEYERNGKPFTELSSIYKNEITIEGFNTMGQVSVTLYTVSRDEEVKSDPVTIQFTPLESPISMTFKSVRINNAFGGIEARWENLSKAEIGVRLMVDSLGERIEKEMYFSSLVADKHFFRGFEAVQTSFVLTFEDKWGNVSDEIYHTGTPLIEVEVPKPWSDLRKLIPYDNTFDLNDDDFIFPHVWDGLLGYYNRYLPLPGSMGSSFTFDFGQVVKLSRMKMWPTIIDGYTMVENVYGQVHIHVFEMWGTKAIDYDKLSDLPYWLHPFSAAQTNQPLPAHTFADDWVYLGRYAVERLDLIPGVTEADIRERGEAGHEWDFPVDLDPVRIIRFFPIATRDGSPPPNNYWQIGELSFWGDINVPQN